MYSTLRSSCTKSCGALRANKSAAGFVLHTVTHMSSLASFAPWSVASPAMNAAAPEEEASYDVVVPLSGPHGRFAGVFGVTLLAPAAASMLPSLASETDWRSCFLGVLLLSISAAAPGQKTTTSSAAARTTTASRRPTLHGLPMHCLRLPATVVDALAARGGQCVRCCFQVRLACDPRRRRRGSIAQQILRLCLLMATPFQQQKVISMAHGHSEAALSASAAAKTPPANPLTQSLITAASSSMQAGILNAFVERHEAIHRRLLQKALRHDVRRRLVAVQLPAVDEIRPEEFVREREQNCDGGDEGPEGQDRGDPELDELGRARDEALRRKDRQQRRRIRVVSQGGGRCLLTP